MSAQLAGAEAIEARARQIYDRSIRRQVEGDHDGRIVVIDTISGDYEIDDSLLAAGKRLMARHPGNNSSFFSIRIGSWALYSFGGSTLAGSKT